MLFFFKFNWNVSNCFVCLSNNKILFYIDKFFAHNKTSGTTDIKLDGVVVAAAFNIASDLDNGDWECITTWKLLPASQSAINYRCCLIFRVNSRLIYLTMQPNPDFIIRKGAENSDRAAGYRLVIHISRISNRNALIVLLNREISFLRFAFVRKIFRKKLLFVSISKSFLQNKSRAIRNINKRVSYLELIFRWNIDEMHLNSTKFSETNQTVALCNARPDSHAICMLCCCW